MTTTTQNTFSTPIIIRIHCHASVVSYDHSWNRDCGMDERRERWETGFVQNGRMVNIVEFDTDDPDWNKGAAETVAMRRALALEQSGKLVDLEFTRSKW